MAQWLSWLERRPVTAEVESSSLFWVVSLSDKRMKVLQLPQRWNGQTPGI